MDELPLDFNEEADGINSKPQEETVTPTETGYESLFSETINNESMSYDDVPVIDSDWVSKSFMVGSIYIAEEYAVNRFTSITDDKFTDTTLGGNISINTSPQFTRYADPKSGGLLSGRSKVTVNGKETNLGMGRYYGKTIDDNSTNVFFEFGVPKFNNTLFYIFSAVDYKTSVIANSGRSTIFYDIGKGIGLTAIVIAFGLIGIAAIIGKHLFQTATNILASPGRFDHYYLKPTMFLYWSTVNSLVTMMATEIGLLSNVFLPDKTDSSKMGIPLKIDATEMSYLRKLMPGIITTNNAINVHAMVTRGQKLYNTQRLTRLKAIQNIESINSLVTMENANKYRMSLDSISPLGISTDNDGSDLWTSMKTPISKDKSYSMDKLPTDIKAINDAMVAEKLKLDNKTTVPPGDGTVERAGRPEDESGWLSKAFDTTKTVFDEGARYAVFRVDHIGSTTASFSNSTTSSGLDDKINSLGKKWRDMKFNLGGGEIPIVTDVARAALDVAVGATDGLTLGLTNVAAAFFSGANIDADKRWDGSTANLPSQSYKMRLRSPSAHPIAQLQNLYIPLASILAGTLPLSTGARSSTSPFLCNMFVRGQNKIDRGMITSLTVTSGTSNLAYNKSRRPLAIDITFTVTDFASVISAPVTNELLSSASVMFDDESGISRYIQSLCSRDLYSTTHVYDKAKIKLSRYFQNHSLMFTPEYIGASMGDTLSGTTIFSLLGNNKKLNYSELY